jgi:hypothetical protein
MLLVSDGEAGDIRAARSSFRSIGGGQWWGRDTEVLFQGVVSRCWEELSGDVGGVEPGRSSFLA